MHTSSPTAPVKLHSLACAWYEYVFEYRPSEKKEVNLLQCSHCISHQVSSRGTSRARQGRNAARYVACPQASGGRTACASQISEEGMRGLMTVVFTPEFHTL